MNTPRIPSLVERGLSSQRCPVTRTLMPNLARTFDGFHISYNPHTADYGCPTTALVLQGRVFFVLNGDHVSEMIDGAEQNGIQGCIDHFIGRIHEANHRSEHRMAVQLAADPFWLHATTLEVIGPDNVARIVAAATRQ